jgi:hypothetical protein
MLPRLFVLVVLIAFVSIAPASWLAGVNSGYLGIYNMHLSTGERIYGCASGLLVTGLVEYDFMQFLGARIEAGYANAKHTEVVSYSFFYDQADFEFKPYFCASLPVILPNVEWEAGSGKNKLNIIVAPGLTYSLLDSKSKYENWQGYYSQPTRQVVDFNSNTPDLTGMVGVRCTLYNGISIWTEFKIWGEQLETVAGTPAPLQVSQDGVVRTFVLGAGYNFF